MRNKYPGTCYRCGGHVPKGDGHFERVNNTQRKKWGADFRSRWLVQHASCAKKYRGTNVHHLFLPDLERSIEDDRDDYPF